MNRPKQLRPASRSASRVAVAALAAAGLAPVLLSASAAHAAPAGTVYAVQAGVGIFAMAADGAGLHTVVADPHVSAAAVSPDGRYLAYGETGSGTLTVTAPGGATVATVAVGAGTVRSVAWSPDSLQAAYSACTISGACWVGVSTPDGSTTLTVPVPAGFSPDSGVGWGPQGLVVAGTFGPASGCPGCASGAYVLDPRQISAPRPLGLAGIGDRVVDPAAAGTGAVAFTVADPAQPVRTVVVPSNGAPRLTVPGAFSGPAWSPDGTTLVVTNGYQIFETRPSLGGTPQRIATFPAYGVSSLSWADGPGPACSVALVPGSVQGIAPAPSGSGYWVTDAYGSVSACGSTGDYGGLGTIHLNQPVLGMAATPDGAGYWLVAYDGGVFTFGDAAPAPANGMPGAPVSLGGQKLAAPIWAMASTPDGHGYWLVGTDGGIFCFGDAGFFGSAVPFHPTHPVVAMAATSDGHGYWLATSDGTVFAFGDARGAHAAFRPAGSAPIVAMGADPAVPGAYWLVASDGTVFPFGGAPAYGSVTGLPALSPARGMAVMPRGSGYWVVDAAGTVHAFGAAPGAGSPR